MQIYLQILLRMRKKLHFFAQKASKSIYIHSIYIVNVRFLHFLASILWESYGNDMGILWCG